MLGRKSASVLARITHSSALFASFIARWMDCYKSGQSAALSPLLSFPSPAPPPMRARVTRRLIALLYLMTRRRLYLPQTFYFPSKLLNNLLLRGKGVLWALSMPHHAALKPQPPYCYPPLVTFLSSSFPFILDPNLAASPTFIAALALERPTPTNLSCIKYYFAVRG